MTVRRKKRSRAPLVVSVSILLVLLALVTVLWVRVWLPSRNKIVYPLMYREELLAATTPQIAVISVGDNHYGHPTQEVLDRLAAIGCTVYRTDIHGNIVLRR